ncbi:hypothetical protein GDO78_020386 [Eleutherodactylus coqui]|uniref:Uncharacterized protein n=1 Tax=Eleutherodactylus coqui TaxID=57060 RepID=A0A8J6B374_ELECQ|nr:hypothetical protein GDO78_020386 [Eleutherodactylus coqui]
MYHIVYCLIYHAHRELLHKQPNSCITKPVLYFRAALAILLLQSLYIYILLLLSYILYYTPELHSLFCCWSHCVHTLLILSYIPYYPPELHSLFCRWRHCVYALLILYYAPELN